MHLASLFQGGPHGGLVAIVAFVFAALLAFGIGVLAFGFLEQVREDRRARSAALLATPPPPPDHPAAVV